MVDKNYKNDKLYTQTKIMYMRFIMRKEREREREREREQINKQIQRIGKKKGNRNTRKEIGKRRKEQDR